MKQQLLDPAACVGKTISGIGIQGHCAVIAFDDSTFLPFRVYCYRIEVREVDPLEHSEGIALVCAGAISKAEIATLRERQDAETTERVEQCERAEYARLKAKYG